MPYLGRGLEKGNYLKLDDISSSFNGSTTTFNLTAGGSAHFPGSAYSILVSLSGVIQEGESGYTIDQDQITFASAPVASDDCYIISLGTPIGIGVPGNGTVNGTQMAKPFSYQSGLLKLDSTNQLVGIKTESPTEALHVVGNLHVTGIITGGSFGGGIVADKIFEGNTAVETVDTGSNGHITFDTEGDERLRITSDGKVGIGSDDPDSILHLQDSNHGAITLQGGTATSDLSLDFQTVAGVTTARIFSASDQGDLRFYTANNEKLRILSGGSVGLGTVGALFPSGKGLVIHDTDNPRIKLSNAATGVSATDGTQIYLDSTGVTRFDNKDGQDIKFDIIAATKVILKADGSVGIGTVTPAANTLLQLEKGAGGGQTQIRVETFDNTSFGILRFVESGHDGSKDKYIIGYNDNHSDQPNQLSLKNQIGHITFMAGGVGTGDEKVRIGTNGQVAIGTQTGETNFLTTINGDVSLGEARGTDNTFIDQKQDGDLHLINSGRTSNGASGTGGAGGVGINKFNTIAGGTSLFRDFVVFNGKNSKVLVVDGSTSRVGVGTDTPDQILHLATTGTCKLRLEDKRTSISDGSQYGVIQFEHQDSGGAGVAAEFAAVMTDTSNGATALQFTTGTPSSKGEKLRITSDGDVSLSSSGTVHGISKLTIKPTNRTTAFDASDGDSWHDVVIKHEGDATNNAVGLAFEVSGDAYHKNAGTGIAAVKQGTDSDYGSDLVFITRGQSVAASEKLRIGANGRVNIGQASDTDHILCVADTNNGTDLTAASSCGIQLQNKSTTDNTFSFIEWRSAGGGRMGRIAGVQEDGNGDGCHLSFLTEPSSGGSIHERLRIGSAGDVAVGTNSWPTGSMARAAGRLLVGDGGDLTLWNETNSAGGGASFKLACKEGGDASKIAFVQMIGGAENTSDQLGFLSLRLSNATGSGIEKLKITSSGQVKIVEHGSSDSGVPFYVSLTGKDSITYGGGQDDTACIRLKDEGGSNSRFHGLELRTHQGGDVRIYAHDQGGDQADLVFGLDNSGIVERFRMKHNGDVGVGVNPVAKFHIGYNTGVNAPATYANATEGLCIHVDRHDNDNFRGNCDFHMGRGSDSTNGGTRFRFFAQARTTGASQEIFRIDGDTSNIQCRGNVWFGDDVQDVPQDMGRLQVKGSSNAYGCDIEHSTMVVMTNEQGTTCQAMVLGDSGPTNGEVLWGVSVNNTNSASPTTGDESGWSEKARVEGNGDFVISGAVTDSSSDDRLKKDRVPLTNAVSKLSNLSTFTYKWNDLAHKLGVADDDVHLGMSAQEVKAVQPEAVSINDTIIDHDDPEAEYMTLKYSRMVPLLVEAIKELKIENDALKARITTLESN